MPRITEYRQNTRAPGSSGSVNVPRLSGATFSAGEAGRSANRLGETVRGFANKVRQVQERKEISQLQADIATARSEITNELSTQIAEGVAAEDNFAGDFNANVEDRIESLRENVSTPGASRALDVGKARIVGHFSEQAAVASATAVAELTKNNFIKAQSQDTVTLLNDPLQFQSILNQMQDNLDNPDGPYAALSPADRERLSFESQQEYAVSAVRGTIRLMGPELAQKQLSDGKFDKYISGEAKQALLGEVKTATIAKRVEQERLRVEAERLETKRQEEEMTDLVNDFADPQQENPLTVPRVIEADLDSSDKITLLNLIEKQNQLGLKKATKDISVYGQLLDRIHAPENDPTKIRSRRELIPFFGKGIGQTELDNLGQEIGRVNDPDNNVLATRSKNFLAAMQPHVTGSTSTFKDPKGDAQFFEFAHYVRTTEAEYRRAGNNPFNLYNPNHKDYLGNEQHMKMFQRSPQQIMKDKVDFLKGMQVPDDEAPVAVPRQPGETAEAYIARIQGG